MLHGQISLYMRFQFVFRNKFVTEKEPLFENLRKMVYESITFHLKNKSDKGYMKGTDLIIVV